MPVPGLSLLGPKCIRGFVSILRYINPTITIITITTLSYFNIMPQLKTIGQEKTLKVNQISGKTSRPSLLQSLGKEYFACTI